jgi:DNA-binding protein
MPQQRKTQMIPIAPAARILMNAGAKRVSAPAAKEFSDILIKYALEISERAAKIARHSGRKTVNEEDIKLAVK